jgi:aspartate aminotransferase
MTTSSKPVFAQQPDRLIPVSDHLSRMMDIPPSRMFLIKNSLVEYRKHHPGSDVYDASQGDGGASLGGVPEEILQEAARRQFEYGSGYTMPYGTPEFRKTVLEDYWQVDSGVGLAPENVVAAAGGRDALEKAYAAMLSLGHGRQGDLILVSRVPWISYNWGPYGIGANVLLAPGDAGEAWAYTEDSIRESVAFAAHHGRKIACMVITNPDNPTGRTLDAATQVKLARCALESGVAYVLFDWIYHYVTDESPNDLNHMLGMFSVEERSRILVLDGITKSLGGSNIRNAHLIAPKKVVEFIVARASHTVLPPYFGIAVAQTAYEMGFAAASRSIVEPTSASRKVLRRFLSEHKLTHIIGQGYYAFINLRPWMETSGISNSEVMGEFLAREHGLAVVPGIYSSAEGADWVRFSYAMPPDRTAFAVQRLQAALKDLESREVRLAYA